MKSGLLSIIQNGGGELDQGSATGVPGHTLVCRGQIAGVP